MGIIQRGSNSYQVNLTYKKQRYRPTFTSEAEAIKWEAEAREALKLGKPIPTVKTPVTKGGGRIRTMQQLYNLTVSEHWEGKGPDESAPARNGSLFVKFVGPDRQINDITSEDISEYITHCREKRGNSNTTIHHKLCAVSVMLKQGIARGLVDNPPYIPKIKKAKVGTIFFLNFGEEQPVLTELEKWGYDLEYDLVIFLIDTGARISEAKKLRWDTVSSDMTSVRFEMRKNGGFHVVPVSYRAREALERRRLKSTGLGPFSEMDVQVTRDHLKRIYTHLGGKYLRILDMKKPFHVYRHSCASRLAMLNENAKRIQEWMGHSSLAVTQIYMHLTPKGLEDTASALERGLKQAENTHNTGNVVQMRP